MSRWRAWILASALAACSGSSSEPLLPDGPTAKPDAATVTPDAPAATPDAGTATTFADYVKDLIGNQTADDTPPVAVDFASPDDQTPGIFDSLFP
jgi:hypothetical protein